MSLASSRARVDYRGDGSSVAFAVPFRFLNADHIAVHLFNSTTGVETLQVLTTNYTVAGANNPFGGTVTMVVAPAADETLTIIRDVPIDQLLNFRENETLSANKIEFALDKITMILQQLDEVTRRAVVLKVTSEEDDGLDAYPEAGGFTSVFPAQVTQENEDNEGAWDFVEQVPAASGGWTARVSGIESFAYPLQTCVDGWEDDVPVYVLIYVHVDADGNTKYFFSSPPPCNVVEV